MYYRQNTDVDVVGTLSGHASWVLSVAFSPDGTHFVSGSADTTVKVWELASRQCVETFNKHTDQVMFIIYIEVFTILIYIYIFFRFGV